MDTATAVVSMRLPVAVVEALDKRAGVESRSRANMVAVLVRQALAEQAEIDEED